MINTHPALASVMALSALGISFTTRAADPATPLDPLEAPSTASADPAESDTAETPMAQPADSESAADEAVGVEEIIVTAQRRKESLQSVPLAVSALTADTMATLGVTDTSSLGALVPGLDITRQSSAATPFLRGVGSSISVIGNEPSVAVYVDGVYLSSAYGSVFSLNNIARIEVLKGPQGTLFGRNATGGVIQVITKDPSHKSSGDVTVGYGNYATAEGTLYVTNGLSDNLAADLSVYATNRQHGWGESQTSGEDIYRHRELSMRNKWLWNPAETTEVHFIVDYNSTQSGEGILNQLLPGTVAADGSQYAGFYNTLEDVENRSSNSQGGASLRVDHDFSFAHLASITAYRDLNGGFRYGQDLSPSNIVDAEISLRSRTLTQELQLLSPTDAKLQWITGLYYFDDISQFDPVRIRGAAAAPFTFNDIFGKQTSHSYAAFAQASYPVLDATKLTAGLRYTRDERELDGRVDADIGNLLAAKQKDSFNKLTHRLALDHTFSESVLGYVSYNRGFKSGGYNLLSITDAPVKPEVLDAYEVGFKSDLLDRRLRFNAAVFYYDYQDIQIQVLRQAATATLNAASAKIKGAEFEFTAVPMRGLNVQGGLSLLDGEYGRFPDAPISSRNPAGQTTVAPGDATGNRTVRTPKSTYNLAVRYTHAAALGEIDYSLSYSHNAGYYWEPDNRLEQPSYGLLNAGIGWFTVDRNWGLRLWGKNLLDEEYYSFVSGQELGDAGSAAPPRTYGVTLSAHFE